jgi:hypothetical protein
MAGRRNPTIAKRSDGKWRSNNMDIKTFKKPSINNVSEEINAGNGGRSSLKMNRKGTRNPIGPNKEQILDKKGWRERIQTSI